MIRLVLVAAMLLTPLSADALTVEGKEYPPTMEVEGRTLKLVGAGVREKTIFKIDIYTMGVYFENMTCNHLKLIHTDEAKVIFMDFVRDIPGDKMMANLKGNFEQRLSDDATEELKKKVRDFVGIFREEIKDKTRVKVVYVPGKGTSTFINGKQQGPIVPGRDFQKVMWSIWFDGDTCCPYLLEDIDRTCRR